MNLTDEVAENFIDFLKILSHGGFPDSQVLENYVNLSLYEDARQYANWVFTVALDLNDEPIEISHISGHFQFFRTVFTEIGLCYSYNSQIAAYTTPK